MNNLPIFTKIILQHLAICGTSIIIFRSLNLGSIFNLDPVSTHKKCIKHFIDLEEARYLQNKDQELIAVNNYWDCHYENLGKTN